jgi:hypothetical protein
MTEVWKDIEGYEGLYQVSNFGRVKSCEKMVVHFRGGFRKLKEKVRKLSKDSDGYLILDLHKDGVGKFKKVYRLVANAFLENNSNKSQVNHINGIKHDNKIDNLEWCTNSENQKHAFSIGLKLPQINNEKCVMMFNKNGSQFIMEFTSISKASKFLGCNGSDITSTLKGRQKSVRNHTFKYKS